MVVYFVLQIRRPCFNDSYCVVPFLLNLFLLNLFLFCVISKIKEFKSVPIHIT